MIKTFKVATGRQSSYTPEGTFKIVNKIKNRPYYKANIPGGHPNNPLGDRWLGINARGTNGTTYAIHGNNNAGSIGTYASAGCVRMYNDDVRWLFDQVKVNTPVVITSTSQSFEAIAASHGYNVGTKLKDVTVSVKSPQPTNTSVQIQASTSSGKDSLFKYSVYDGKKWTTIKDYTSSKSVKWKPTKAGSYKLRVQAKSKNSKKNFDDEKVISYNIFTPASVKSIKADKTSPQPTKTNVALTASSNNNNNNLFKFLVYDGSKWKTIQDFSSKTKVNWKPQKAGSYKIKVQAKHKQSKKKYDSEKTISYKVFEPAKLTSFKTEKASPTPAQSSVELTATSSNNKEHLFKFLVKDGDKWKTIQDFSSKTKASWKPTKEGSYQLKVQVKHKSSKKKFDAEKVMDHVVFKKATINTIKTDKVSPQFSKTNVVISASPASNKDHLYKFSIHDGNSWKTVQNYSNSSSFNWKPSHEGRFKIKVEVKHKLSKEKYDAVKEIDYYINKPVTIQELTPTVREHKPGVPVTISAKASGGSDLMYRFERLDNSNWQLLQDYSTNNSFKWTTPTAGGDYKIRVLVKSKGATKHDALLEKTYTVIVPNEIKAETISEEQASLEDVEEAEELDTIEVDVDVDVDVDEEENE